MFKCNWEISLFKAVVREMSKLTGKPVKEVLTQLPDEDLKKKYNEIINRYKQDNIYIQPMAVSPDTFEKELNELIEKYPDKKIVVSIDNLENVLLNGQTHKQAMDAVVRIINVAKEKHSFISFIILNQLNWDIMEREDPKNHFPRPKDIYNSSAFFKLCDVVMVKHMPFRLGINKYGVFSKQRYEYLEDKFKIESRTGSTASFDAIGKVFYHFLKSRDVPLEFDIEDLFVEAIYDAPEEDKTPVFEENKETPFF